MMTKYQKLVGPILFKRAGIQDIINNIKAGYKGFAVNNPQLDTAVKGVGTAGAVTLVSKLLGAGWTPAMILGAVSGTGVAGYDWYKKKQHT